MQGLFFFNNHEIFNVVPRLLDAKRGKYYFLHIAKPALGIAAKSPQ